MNLIDKYLAEVKKMSPPKKFKKDKQIKVGDKVKIDSGMIGGGETGKVIELDDDIVAVKFNKKVHGSKSALYYIGDLKKA